MNRLFIVMSDTIVAGESKSPEAEVVFENFEKAYVYISEIAYKNSEINHVIFNNNVANVELFYFELNDSATVRVGYYDSAALFNGFEYKVRTISKED